MTAIDARDFLGRFDADALADRGILNGETRQLNFRSVAPLRALMTEHGVSRLVSAGGWLLDADGTFQNPRAEGDTVGNVDDPAGTRQVFNYQNATLNPHFSGVQAVTAEDGGGFTFALERDLQKALRGNIEQLEPGLRIVDGGTEQVVDAGRIDIIAEAPDGSLVVVELKAGRADLSAVGQVLSYMGTVGAAQGSVRGILVAGSFDPRAVMAARAVPALQLRAYSFEFVFGEP